MKNKLISCALMSVVAFAMIPSAIGMKPVASDRFSRDAVIENIQIFAGSSANSSL